MRSQTHQIYGAGAAVLSATDHVEAKQIHRQPWISPTRDFTNPEVPTEYSLPPGVGVSAIHPAPALDAAAHERRNP